MQIHLAKPLCGVNLQHNLSRPDANKLSKQSILMGGYWRIVVVLIKPKYHKILR